MFKLHQIKNQIPISIKYKLFLAMLSSSCAVVFCLFFFMQWSFNSGFLNYVNTLEHQRLDRLQSELEKTYSQHGNWQFIQGNTRLWLKFLVLSLPEQESSEKYLKRIEEETRRGGTYTWEPLLPGTAQSFEKRIVFLDAEKKVIFGPPEIPEGLTLSPIRFQGKNVGYLGMTTRQNIYNAHQLRFVNEQKLAMTMAACVVLLIAGGLSLLMAHRIVKPVKILAASARCLAMGKFETRANVSSSDELGQFSLDFNSMARTLEKTEKARRQWLADFSHELRTPLAVLRAEIEAIQDGIRKPIPKTMHALHSEVMHLNHLVNDLHELSLADIGALTYRKETVNLLSIVNQKVDLFASEFAEKDIAIKVGVPTGGEIPIYADPMRIQQLITNLLDNSLKYTNGGGQLHIAIERNTKRVKLHLRDSAPTVPSGELPKLFNKLYRVENSRNRSTGGSGLGLAICKNIVEAHEGTIDAQASPLGGIWITVDLPLTC